MTQEYYIIKRGRKLFTGIGKSVPEGVSLSIYDDLKKAEKCVRRLADRFKLGFMFKILKDPYKELIDMAKQGYAGAVFNDKQTILFRHYDPETYIVMYDPPASVPRSLQEDGTWHDFVEPDNLEFSAHLLTRDDQLIKALDVTPYWGWMNQTEYFTWVHSETACPLAKSDLYQPKQGRQKNVAVFSHVKLAEEASDQWFAGSNADRQKYEIQALPGGIQFIHDQIKSGIGVLLNPLSHRCLQGRFIASEENLLLESFSGMWTCDSNFDFKRLEGSVKTDRRLNSSTFLFYPSEIDVDSDVRLKNSLDWMPDENNAVAVAMPLEYCPAEQVVHHDGLKFITIRCASETIQNKDFSPLKLFFETLVSAASAVRFRDAVEFRISGFEEEERSPSEIPQVRNWYTSLANEIPYICYFLNADNAQLHSLVLSLIPEFDTKDAEQGKHQEKLFEIVVQLTLHAMKMAQQLGDDPAEQVQKIFEAFEIEPNPDLYESMLASIQKNGEEH